MASESTAQEVDPIEELDRLEANDGARARADEQGVELPADTPDPSAGISDAEPATEQERLYAGKFRSEEELERGYTNLETELGRKGNELGEMRRELDQYRQTYQPPQGQEPQSGPLEQEALSREQLEELAMNDPLAAIDYIATIRAAEMTGQLYEHIQKQMQPITTNVNQQASRQALDELTQQYGADMVLANKQAVADMVSADEEFYLDPATRKQRLGMALAAAEYERQRTSGEAQRAGNGQPAGGVGNVHVEGGSTPPQPSRETESDPILAEMEEVAPRRDLFGPRPGLFRGTG